MDGAIWERDIVLLVHSSWYAEYLPYYYKRMQCNGEWNDTFKHLKSRCDLDLWNRSMILSHDISSWYAKYLC